MGYPVTENFDELAAALIPNKNDTGDRFVPNFFFAASPMTQPSAFAKANPFRCKSRGRSKLRNQPFELSYMTEALVGRLKVRLNGTGHSEENFYGLTFTKVVRL
jgi:hypothetical protein